MSQDVVHPSSAANVAKNKAQGAEGSHQQPLAAPVQGGAATRGGPLSPGTGIGGGGSVTGSSFAVGGGLLAGTKSVISVQSKRLAEDVNYVYDRQIMFTNKIQFQRSRIEDLAFRIAKATKELAEKRRYAGPDNSRTLKGGVSAAEREAHKVENRLQQTLTKASVLDAANAGRKERVDCLRREKMAESKGLKRLEEDLQRARTMCITTTRATQQMVDEKEKTRREIEVLKQEVVKDLDAFRGEFQGITESLAAAKEATQESNAKLEYMTRSRTAPTAEKSKPSTGATGATGATTGGRGGRGAAAGRGGDGGAGVGVSVAGRPGVPGAVRPLSRAQRLRQQSNMSFWLILKKKNDLQAKEARVQDLRAMLEKISAATSLATLDDFVPVMLEAEEENYNLFKLINELNKELEELEREKNLISGDIDRLTQAGSKKEQAAVKLSLQQQIDRSRATAKGYDQAYSRDVEVIKSIEGSLVSVFNKVGSSDKAVTKQLTAMGVTDRNILLFLAQIEEQIEHIVQVYNAATDSTTVSNVRRPTTPVVNQATGQRVPSMCPPNPPSSDAIDDNLGVLVTEEDADGAYRPINTARVADSIKEKVLRMPQGQGGGKISGMVGKVAKLHLETLPGQAGRMKAAGLSTEKMVSGAGGAIDAVSDSFPSGGGGGFHRRGPGA